MSIPFSSAIFLAKGEIAILASDDSCWVLDVELSLEEDSDLFSSFGTSAFLLGSCFLPPPETIAETSVPSGPIMVKTESTGLAPPSSVPIYNKVPLNSDSKSCTALSVSISAKISPSFTVSPSFLCHLATFPSVMVSESRGIVMTSTPAGISAELLELSSFSTGFVVSTSVALSSVLCSSGMSEVSDFFASELPPFKDEISSRSSPIIAKTESTGDEPPSSVPTYNKVPLNSDSKS